MEECEKAHTWCVQMPGLDGDMENPEDGHSPVKPYDDEDLIESRGKAPPLPPSYPPSMAHRASQMQMHNHMMQVCKQSLFLHVATCHVTTGYVGRNRA